MLPFVSYFFKGALGLNEFFSCSSLENIHLKSNCHTHPFIMADVMVSYNLKY